MLTAILPTKTNFMPEKTREIAVGIPIARLPRSKHNRARNSKKFKNSNSQTVVVAVSCL
jgi:hypothetical protein